MNFIKKILTILAGKLIAYIVKFTNKNLFCFFINLFYRNDGKLYYRDNFYVKKTKSERKVAFTNKRVLRLVNNYDSQIQKFRDAYLLDMINFSSGETIVDCGANIGELNIALKEKGLDLDYIAFEPDGEIYNCLKYNNPEKNSTLYNIGLSNKNTKQKLFLDSEGGNSSLIDFGATQVKQVDVSRLDSLIIDIKKIKLLKVDAEGYEPEVLEGSTGIFDKIEYISVDFGNERGFDQESTIVDVNKLLSNNGFSLVGMSNIRMVGLYKNNLCEEL
tara:strand:- start:1142 stop:1963 length:822 start_codon:yes stop_codon:yes gene_type:complete